MKNEKGITLTSLVIVIIILLIISSIAVYSGIGSIKYAGYNKAKSEMEMMQANVNDWYDEYINVEVKDEEILQGQTAEQVKLSKQQAVIAKYGEAVSDSETLTKTVNAAQEQGITLQKADYKLLSESYLKETLGLNESFEFLINIPSRTVLLFGGYSYDGTTYYTAEDFGILNVKSTEMTGITFNLEQGDNTEVIISDLKLSYGENNKTDISKFIVQYKKTSDTNWNDATSSVVKFVDEDDNNKTKFKFSMPETKTPTSITNYDVKITTTDKKFQYTRQIQVRSPWILVTFDPNGGTLGNNTKYVKVGETYGELPEPEQRAGYTFKGWNGKNKFDESKYTNLDNYTLTDTPYKVTKIYLKSNTTYKIGIKNYNGFDGKNNSELLINDNMNHIYNTKWTAIAHSSHGVSSLINYLYTTGEDGVLYIGFGGTQSQLDTIWENTDVQIEEGSTATAYEPYYITSATEVVQNGAHTLKAIWEEDS